MKRFLILLVSSIAFLFFFSSFQEDGNIKEVRQQLMDEEIERRLNEFRSKEIANCRKRAMKEAERVVDSILIANAINVRADNTAKPPKPQKPDKPEILKTKDSLPVEPLFEEN